MRVSNNLTKTVIAKIVCTCWCDVMLHVDLNIEVHMYVFGVLQIFLSELWFVCTVLLVHAIT